LSQTDARFNVPTMVITTGITCLGISLWTSLRPVMLSDLGASDLQVSVASFAWEAGTALAAVCGGRLADRWGRVPIVVGATYLAACSVMGASLCASWLQLSLWFMVWNLAVGGQGPANGALIGESAGERQSGKAFGAVEFAVCIAFIIGPLVGARMITLWGTRSLLLVSCILFILAALARHLRLKETLSQPEEVSGGTMVLLQVLFMPQTRRLLVPSLVLNTIMCLSLRGPFMTLHAYQTMGLSKVQIQLLTAAGSAAAALASLGAAWLVPRWGSRLSLAIGVLGLGGGVLLWCGQQGLLAIMACYITLHLFMQLAYIALRAYQFEHTRAQNRATMLGVVSTLTGLGASLSIPLAGWLRTWALPGTPFWLSLAIGGVGAAILMVEKEQPAPGAETLQG